MRKAFPGAAGGLFCCYGEMPVTGCSARLSMDHQMATHLKPSTFDEVFLSIE